MPPVHNWLNLLHIILLSTIAFCVKDDMKDMKDRKNMKGEKMKAMM